MALIRSRGAAGVLVGVLLFLSVASTSGMMVDLAQVLSGQGGYSEIIKVAQNANRTQWPSSFTFFAPSNGAVKKYSCLKDPGHSSIAGRVLQYHMLTAAYANAQIVTRTTRAPWMAYTALAGQRLNITNKNGKIQIIGNGVTAKLNKADVLAKATQSVQGIDKMFIPATIQNVCGQHSSASFSAPSVLKRRSRLLDVAVVLMSLTTIGHFYWSW